LAASTAASALACFLTWAGLGEPASLSVCAVLGWLGLYSYEQAYVRAGQLPPLS
jgi:hypothetical protein